MVGPTAEAHALRRKELQVVHGRDDEPDTGFGGVDRQSCVTRGESRRILRSPVSAAVLVPPLSEERHEIGKCGLRVVQHARTLRVGRRVCTDLLSPLLHQEWKLITVPGVQLVAGDARNPDIRIAVATDGAVVITASVAGEGGNFGSMHIDPHRLQALLEAASDFAARAFDLLDGHQDVQQLALVVAILGANGRLFGRPVSSNSMSLGGSHSLPQIVVAPEPPVIVRRVDLAESAWRERVVAALRRIFADAGAATS